MKDIVQDTYWKTRARVVKFIPGTMITNSVLSYIILGLEKAGLGIKQIEPVKGNADNNANKTNQTH